MKFDPIRHIPDVQGLIVDVGHGIFDPSQMNLELPKFILDVANRIDHAGNVFTDLRGFGVAKALEVNSSQR
jgi:hypothetical protein